MKNLQIIRAELVQIRSQLTKIPVFFKGAGQSVSSPSAPRNEAELGSLVIRLKGLLSDLAAQENLARLQKWQSSPQSTSRWSSQQKEKEAREVLEEVLALKGLADELLAKNGFLSGMDAGGGLISQLRQEEQELAKIMNAHVQVPDRPAYTLPQPTAHPLGADSAASVLAWVILTIQYLKKKTNSQGNRVA